MEHLSITNTNSWLKYTLWCQYSFIYYCTLVLPCLKIGRIRCFIHLELICHKFKYSLFVLFSGDILFVESKITTKFCFENCFAQEKLQHLVKSDYIFFREQDEMVLYLFFLTFDFKVSLCLSCNIEIFLYFNSSVSFKSCFK